MEIMKMWIVDVDEQFTHTEGHIKDSETTTKFRIEFENKYLKEKLSDEDYQKSRIIGHLFEINGETITFSNLPEYSESEIFEIEERAEKWWSSIIFE